MSYVLQDMVKMLEAVTEALNKSNERSDKISTAVEKWLRFAEDESLLEAARVTYLECADDITEIMSGDIPEAEK